MFNEDDDVQGDGFELGDEELDIPPEVEEAGKGEDFDFGEEDPDKDH